MRLRQQYIFIVSCIIFSSLVSSQEIPNEFYQFQSAKFLLDAGENWESNTIFGPLRFNHGKNINDSLNVQARFGSYVSTDAIAFYGFGHFTFKSHYHGYIYPRVVNKPEKYDRYSGVPRDIERAGFSSGETDLSGISYENSWMILQFGRGRQSWGAGNDIQLALSEDSPAFDYGMLDLDFGKLRVRYFHGYLETHTLSYNRYISGRGIEWKNQKSLVFGLSETVIYSGKNRPIDFAYFNPMSTHLEIELNERQNQNGHDNGNGVWQASFDWLARPNTRLSCNYLFDEFVLDDVQKQEGKGHSRAYSLKAIYTPINTKSSIVSLYTSMISVGTNTFRHESGYNNFIQRNKPLGWSMGSDSRESNLGFNALYNSTLITIIEIGQREIGEKNIIGSPYDGYTNYHTGPFPSGKVEKILYVCGRLQWWWKQNLSLITEFEYNDSNKNDKEFHIKIGVDIFSSINKKI